MKRVYLNKIDGVRREPRFDYKDDGASFKGYIYKEEIPFTYTTWKNDIFLSIRMDMAGLDYEDYKNLKERDDFNGVDRSEWDPIEFKKDLDVCYNYLIAHRVMEC